ncbi:uncharacterized protein METZ01_LOCUS84796 [marine metagenome]|uniref:Uncharacterized protein n=1 Tax=marine metagenome TaxID=408172 RepID=A0A381UUV1_9ZZZZ
MGQNKNSSVSFYYSAVKVHINTRRDDVELSEAKYFRNLKHFDDKSYGAVAQLGEHLLCK